MPEANFPIDAVVTWVDGNSPEHRKQRARYDLSGQSGKDDVAGEIRYSSLGEINYCIASILRFAPYIRNIFIVTDGQDPGLGDFVEKYFPGQSGRLKIVDHRVIYRGYEKYLPVFNSLSIETLLWRIPGLSEHFLYFNDDVMLVNDSVVEDYFVGDRIVVYGRYCSLIWARIDYFLRPRNNGYKPLSFKNFMLNAAKAAGERFLMYRLSHSPHPMKVSTFREFFEKNPELMENNIRCRFREPQQFNPAELCYILNRQKGNTIRRSAKGPYLYLLPQGHEYMQRHIERFRNAKNAKFCCVNSLGYADPNEIEAVLDWLAEVVGIDRQ